MSVAADLRAALRIDEDVGLAAHAELWQINTGLDGQASTRRAATRVLGFESVRIDSVIRLHEVSIHRTITLEAKEFDKAEANLLRLVETSPAPYFGSADDGVRGFHTRHTLAGNYLEHQRPREARNFEQ